jgi:hypothetical protein
LQWGRVTRWVSENIAQTVAQPVLAKLDTNYTYLGWKNYLNIGYQEKCHFFAENNRKSPTTVIITWAPVSLWQDLSGLSAYGDPLVLRLLLSQLSLTILLLSLQQLCSQLFLTFLELILWIAFGHTVKFTNRIKNLRGHKIGEFLFCLFLYLPPYTPNGIRSHDP